jgi:nicotinamide riboside kinase
VEKVAIVGAECTGKSTLLNALAAELPARINRTVIAFPEVLREFCEREKRTPTIAEQWPLMQSQILRENLLKNEDSPHLMISDCAPITIAIYSQIYFQDNSLMAAASEHHRSYKLTLITTPDIGWKEDGLMRDGVHIQLEFHRRLLNWVKETALRTIPIVGNGPEREAQAMAAIMNTYARGPA